MSTTGGYIKTAAKLFSSLEEGKPHTSITDWVEVLSGDRYEELSLDGIPELVESINIQGHQGTTEAARAIRKKLKYGNVHRQLRALVILRALTENAGKGFKINWANAELLNRLKEMAGDNLLDPKVRKRLLLVFHAWSIQYADEPRMQHVAGLHRQFTGGPASRKPSVVPTHSSSASAASSPITTTSSHSRKPSTFTETDDLWEHSWAPAAGQRGPDTYADLATAKAEAEDRKRQREAQILIEQREAEVERKEREFKRKQDMAGVEARRQKEAAEEQERRRQMKEQMKNKQYAPRTATAPAQPKKPKFDFQKEKPQILVSVANAIQAANNLVNSCRHLDREHETVLESPKVQDNLDKAKAARRIVIRYLQVVTDESFVGTLLDANEKVVESIQLYDKLSKPAVLDSDSEDEHKPPPKPLSPQDIADAKQIELLNKRLAAQKLEADRTGELQQLQNQQKKESAKQQRRQVQRQASGYGGHGGSGHPDLQDLDFSSSVSGSRGGGKGLPPPLKPDSDHDSVGSDYDDYDSSDAEWQASRSRRQSHVAQKPKAPSNRNSRVYAQFDDDEPGPQRAGLLDPNDPFGDPFADVDTPVQERSRMQWREV